MESQLEKNWQVWSTGEQQDPDTFWVAPPAAIGSSSSNRCMIRMRDDDPSRSPIQLLGTIIFFFIDYFAENFLQCQIIRDVFCGIVANCVRLMYKLYRHKLYREQILSAQIVLAQFVSDTNFIGHKLYRAQIVSCNKLFRGTKCIGPKLYRGTNCIGQKLLITKFLITKFLSNKVPKITKYLTHYIPNVQDS